MKTTYYDVLKVSKTAPSEVIRASYKVLSQKYHPDRNMSNFEAANENMRRLNEAYDVLIDEKRRADYDNLIESCINSNGASNESERSKNKSSAKEYVHRDEIKRTSEGFIIDASNAAERLIIVIHYLIGVVYLFLIIWNSLPDDFRSNYPLFGMANIYAVGGALIYYIWLNKEGIAFREIYRKRPFSIALLLIWSDIFVIGSLIGGSRKYVIGQDIFNADALIIFFIWLVPIVIFEIIGITLKWLIKGGR